MRPRWLLCLTGLAVLAGCGADGDTKTVTAAPTSTVAAPATPSRAADKRVAQRALMQLSDLPSGWTADDDENETTRSNCAAVRNARSDVNARASAPDFSKENSQVSNAVYVYADEAQARSAFGALVAGDTRVCLGKQLRDQLAKNVKDDDVKIQDESTSELNITPVGSQSAAARITIPYKADVDSELDTDLVFVRVGRAISLIFAIDIGRPFDDDLRDELSGIAARRLGQQLEQR